MLAIIPSRYQYGPFLFLLLQKLCVITDSDAERGAAIESLYVTRPIRVAFAWPIMG